MNAMGGENTTGEAEGGPMWGRFFDAIGQDDTESAISGSHIPPEIQTLPSMQHLSHLQQSPHSEVHPNDSASAVGDDSASALEGYPRRKGVVVPSVAGTLPADDGSYVFKFRTPSGRTHRFQARHDDVEHIREIVSGKLATDPFFTDFKSTDPSEIRPDPIDFHLSYTDADGDSVHITSDHDVTDAVKIARSAGTDRVVLFVQGGKGWAEAGAAKSEAKAAEVTAAQQEVKEVEKAEAILPEVATGTPPSLAHVHHQGEVLGVPKDLLLPASIGALAVVIVAIFTISRFSSSRY